MKDNFIEELNSFSKEVLVKYLYQHYCFDSSKKDQVIRSLKRIKGNLDFEKKQEKFEKLWDAYMQADKEYNAFLKELQDKYKKNQLYLIELTSFELDKLKKLNDNISQAYKHWNENREL